MSLTDRRPAGSRPLVRRLLASAAFVAASTGLGGATEPAPPLRFALAEARVELRRSSVFMGGACETELRVGGDGDGVRTSRCRALGPGSDPERQPTVKRFVLPAESLLSRLEELFEAGYFQLTGLAPSGPVALVLADGVVDQLTFSKGHGSSTTLSVRLGEYRHSFSWDDASPPCGLEAIVSRLEAACREAAATSAAGPESATGVSGGP